MDAEGRGISVLDGVNLVIANTPTGCEERIVFFFVFDRQGQISD
jgi:hypothetical protein